MLLQQLRVGDNFEFISLEKVYRNLHVRHINEGSILIGGEKLELKKTETTETEIWHKLNDYSVSSACSVRKLKGKTVVKEKESIKSFIL